jgi:hypothetical protein
MARLCRRRAFMVSIVAARQVTIRVAMLELVFTQSTKGPKEPARCNPSCALDDR